MNETAKFKVLVVDDQADDLKALVDLLKHEHEVLTAPSGREGLALAAGVKPDLVLVAVDLPETGGFEVLRQLKEDADTRDIPVIFISNHPDADREEAGLKLGAADYVTKPFSGGLVRARARVHLRLLNQTRIIEGVGQVDALTGLPNRLGFQERLALEWGRARRENLTLSLILMDVDNFKAYNEKYGRPQGDELLKTLGRVIRDCLNRPTDFGACLDREIFGVTLPNTELEGAVKIAEDIRAGLAGARIPQLEGGPPSRAAVSLGVAAMVPAANNSIEGLFTAARGKLREAKAQGRDRVVY
ncbi:MAG: diguanylate cyclase [Candidatus Adiutrix sp.]|jgi:diguanylate cyclase (GGDEF)-like protein|nr:diguanylate cyclase [Candidatus Adiutrix sp.]